MTRDSLTSEFADTEVSVDTCGSLTEEFADTEDPVDRARCNPWPTWTRCARCGQRSQCRGLPGGLHDALQGAPPRLNPRPWQLATRPRNPRPTREPESGAEAAPWTAQEAAPAAHCRGGHQSPVGAALGAFPARLASSRSARPRYQPPCASIDEYFERIARAAARGPPLQQSEGTVPTCMHAAQYHPHPENPKFPKDLK